MEPDGALHGFRPDVPPLYQDVLQLLAQIERRLARAVGAASAGDQARLLRHLTALAVLVHLSTRLTLDAHSIGPSPPEPCT